MPRAKWYALVVGSVAFILLLSAQVKLFEHRMVLDSAVSTFIICNTQDFDVTEKRFAIGINQVLPVLATYFTDEVKWVVKAFYANDFLWYFAFFLLFLFGFNKPHAAMALVVGYFTILGHHYFILTYSVPLAWPLLLLLMLIMQKQICVSRLQAQWLVVFLCLFFLAFSNPINTITTLLFLAYFAAGQINNREKLTTYIITTAAFLLLVIAKNLNPEPYDVNRLTQTSLGFAWLHTPHLINWAKGFLIAYPIGTLLLAGGLVFTVLKLRQPKKIQGIVLVGAYIYLAIVFIAYGCFGRYPHDDLVAKAITPVVLLFTYIFAEKLVQAVKLQRSYVLYSSFATIVILLSLKYILLLNNYVQLADKKISIAKQLIKQAPQNGAKCYVNKKNLGQIDDLPEINTTEIIMVSALADREPNDVYIVVGTDEEIAQLYEEEDDVIYHTWGWFFRFDVDTAYFNFNTSNEWVELQPEVIYTE